jgi:hypothetical protein
MSAFSMQDMKAHIPSSTITLMRGKVSGNRPKRPKRKEESVSKRIPLSKHMKDYLGGRLSYLYDEVVRWAFHSAQPLVREKQYLKASSDAKELYFGTSSKSDSKTLALSSAIDPSKRVSILDQELSAIKQTMTNMLAGEQYRVTLPQIFDAYCVATVTTGVVSNVCTINPTGCSEFATLAALFDEYKETGITVLHKNPLIINTLSNPGGGSVNTTYRITAADPTDNTAMTSVDAGLQHGVHELLSLAHGNLSVQLPLLAWKIRLPPDTVFVSGGTMALAQDTWMAANFPVPYCFLKHYTVQAVTTATTVESAIIQHSLEFRIRE